MPHCNAMKRNWTSFLSQIRPTEKSGTDYKDLVWVQCEEYRCLAYFNADGKWINFYTGKQLKGFVSVIG
jgi:hypothetical protein